MINEVEGVVHTLVFPEDPPPLLGGQLVALTRELHPGVREARVVRYEAAPALVPAHLEALRIPEGDRHLLHLVERVLHLDAACGLGLASAAGWLVQCLPTEASGSAFMIVRNNRAGASLLLTEEIIIPRHITRVGSAAAVLADATPAQPIEWESLLGELGRWAGGGR